MKHILVCGGAGFIGHHLAKSLKEQGHIVLVADLKPYNEYVPYTKYCDYYECLDLSEKESWEFIEEHYKNIDEIYQLAADMGGAGYLFTGENDYNVMHNSALINLHCSEFASKWKSKVFYTSSACMYPEYNQQDPNNPKCSEDSAYPAAPDSEYGWEKLFSERVYLAAAKNRGLDVKIARLHNVYGPEGSWSNGKEKAPAAICRKVAKAKLDGSHTIEVWGDGNQTRSFLYIDDCIKGIHALMNSTVKEPLNIGSEEMVSINQLVKYVDTAADTTSDIQYLLDKPQGVRGRNSDNNLIRYFTGWDSSTSLQEGIKKTYNWILTQILNNDKDRN